MLPHHFVTARETVIWKGIADYAKFDKLVARPVRGDAKRIKSVALVAEESQPYSTGTQANQAKGGVKK